jgi:sugar lactone lactonase YvrE
MTKPRIDPIRWQPPPSRPLPEPDLTATLHVVPLPGNAPEDVVADAEGNIWTGVDDGRIIRITPDGASTQVMVNTGGRPRRRSADLRQPPRSAAIPPRDRDAGDVGCRDGRAGVDILLQRRRIIGRHNLFH